MKIAISASGSTLESNVDPRFGRCPYFLIYDTDSNNFEVLDNQGRQTMGGAGIQAAQLIVDNKAEAVITGNIGPNAFKVLSAGSIKVFSGVNGVIKNALDKLEKEELEPASASDVPSHFGTGSGWKE